jgi:hypothetical protein
MPRACQSIRVLTANEWRLWGIPHNRHYVDSWVMFPAGVFVLVGAVPFMVLSA